MTANRGPIYPLLIGILLILCGIVGSAHASPAEITLNQLRNKVDNWLAPRWQTVQDRQTDYFNQHGHYWQGLKTHTFDLAYTDAVDAEAPADALGVAPTDQEESWLDVFPEFQGGAIPAVLIIDVYDGPSGQGYTATLIVLWNGNTYMRAAQVGPEEWRAQGWHQVVQAQVVQP
jgi:hypothetical protein